MKVGLFCFVFCVAGVITAGAEPPFHFDFNQFADGPIEGQFEWEIYNKVKDSSALSIMDELGTSETMGDKALVIQRSTKPIRCVTGEPVRWLPGRTLTMEFDFKIAIEPVDLSIDKPVLTVMVGNALLSEKARWALLLEATADGDWRFSGDFPDHSSKKIYAENFLIRSMQTVSISDWYRMVLVVEKESEPDSFKASVEIRHAESGKILTSLVFSDETKNKVAAAMWNTSRAHVGFYAPNNQLGLVCIDNLTVSSSE